MRNQLTRVDLKSDIIESDPGCDGIKPTGVVLGAVTGDAETSFPEEKPRTITHDNLANLAGFEATLNFKVPNKLGAGGEQLPISVKFTRGTAHWLNDIVEQTDELQLLKERLVALYEFRTRLLTRDFGRIRRPLLDIIKDPKERVELLENFGATDASNDLAKLSSD